MDDVQRWSFSTSMLDLRGGGWPVQPKSSANPLLNMENWLPGTLTSIENTALERVHPLCLIFYMKLT